MNYRTDKLMIDGQTHAHTHTHAGNDNTRRPKLASGKNVSKFSHSHTSQPQWLNGKIIIDTGFMTYLNYGYNYSTCYFLHN